MFKFFKNLLGREGLALLLAFVFAYALPLQAQDPLQSVPETDPDRVKKVFEACVQCHGPGGVSNLPSRPTIAGQKGDYVARQLTAFVQAAKEYRTDSDQDADDGPLKDPQAQGRIRSDPIMEHMVEGLDASTIVKIAAVVSKLPCRTDEAVIKSPPPTPPSITHECALCHGEDGVGDRFDTPNLAGQQRAYLRRELLLIRESAWGATPREGETSRKHPIMESQVARLKIQDVDAVAQYYSELDCRGNNPK